ncbi:ribokinase [Paenibacillus kobensis]|uniref:ribokinase n=1 Tax=Paenibacillus kobensis TaxID=59841 RepID=UPI000FDB9CF0|nr:ribokinase [Paenibacillus kobensis]
MNGRHIVVAGSLNMDVVSRVERFPRPGETIRGTDALYSPGGKGANQAVAAARSGAATVMVGAVGTDGFGQQLLGALASDGITVEGVGVKEGSSGIALVTVDGAGENQIVLCEGANGKVGEEELRQFEQLMSSGAAVLLQNEIPWEANAALMKLASQAGVPVLYNPAPAAPVPDEVLPLLDTIVLNETETETVTGIAPSDETKLKEAAGHLLAKGVAAVLITLGAAGSYYHDQSGTTVRMPARQVSPVDTTAAGDTFIGAYAAVRYGGASSSQSPEEALSYATAASALAVMKPGAQSSIPSRPEVVAWMKDEPTV